MYVQTRGPYHTLLSFHVVFFLLFFLSYPGSGFLHGRDQCSLHLLSNLTSFTTTGMNRHGPTNGFCSAGKSVRRPQVGRVRYVSSVQCSNGSIVHITAHLFIYR
ncbi:hypothetical protein F5X96DRAFT_627926 [Biscogniauxia mediterranea]|nr:hypothetical protein F5X96DRAFT_627926 [Biscogniauxia mediterranea]